MSNAVTENEGSGSAEGAGTEPVEDPRSGDSGAFLIDRARVHETMLPPPDASAAGIAELGELESAALSLIPEPPKVSPSELRAQRASERAQLEVEDLSLRLDNPLNASSLVPPTHAAEPRYGRAVFVVVALAAVGLAGFALRGAPSWGTRTTPAPARVLSEPGSEQISARSTGSASATAALQAPASTVSQAVPELAASQAAVPAVPTAVAVVSQAEPDVDPVTATRPVAPREAEPAAAAPAALVPAPRVEPARTVAAAEVSAVSEARAEPSATTTELEAAARSAGSAPAPGLSAGAAEPAAAELEEPTAPAVTAVATTTSDALPQVAATTALPESPSREDIARGIEATRDAVLECAAGQHGLVRLDVSIAGSGRVSHVVVGGAFAGTPAGSCMARAVRAARFPAFTNTGVTVGYPMSI